MAKNKRYQNTKELDTFIDMMRGEGIRSFIEIGSRFGGTLDRIGRTLPLGSRIVSVDICCEERLDDAVINLRNDGYDAHLIIGNSADLDTVNQVKALGPFDLVFIDANHKTHYVWSDWNNYGPMGRIVAFHDIGWKFIPERPDRAALAVPEVWNEIKLKYRHAEISYLGASNGIGVLWKDG